MCGPPIETEIRIANRPLELHSLLADVTVFLLRKLDPPDPPDPKLKFVIFHRF